MIKKHHVGRFVHGEVVTTLSDFEVYEFPDRTQIELNHVVSSQLRI